jgi:hypothetical protein
MRRILSMSLGFTLLACGGKASEPAPETAAPVSDSTGGEALTQKAEEATGEEQSEPVEPASGPAKLTVEAKVGRDTAKANIKVMNEEGTVIAEGLAGERLGVQSGDLLIEATITDPKAMIDLPTIQQSVSLKAGDEVSESVSFPRSLVRVTVNIKGKVDATAIVTLSKGGVQVAKLTSGDENYVSITPGRYQATVKSKRAEITVSELTLNEGATHNLPLNVNL